VLFTKPWFWTVKSPCPFSAPLWDGGARRVLPFTLQPSSVRPLGRRTTSRNEICNRRFRRVLTKASNAPGSAGPDATTDSSRPACTLIDPLAGVCTGRRLHSILTVGIACSRMGRTRAATRTHSPPRSSPRRRPIRSTSRRSLHLPRTRITAWERCDAHGPPRLSLNRRGGSRHPRAASSASGVTERRPSRFCHWYCDVMAKPMLTFLAGPQRPLAETLQARVLYPKAQDVSCERFRVSLRSSRHRRCRPAATFPEFPATIDPLSAFPPQVVRGPWERSSDPDTRHLSSSRRGLEARGDAPEPNTHSVRDRGPLFARFSAKSGARRPARSAFHRVSSRMRLE